MLLFFKIWNVLTEYFVRYRTVMCVLNASPGNHDCLVSLTLTRLL